MELLSQWILKYFSAPFLSIGYLICGVALAFLYIPQIIRLSRDTTGAAAISIFSSTSMMLARMLPILYAIAVAKDWVMAIVILLDWLGRLAVTAVAVYKRQKYKTNNGVSSPEMFRENLS